MSAGSDQLTVAVCVSISAAHREQLQSAFPEVRFLFSEPHQMPDGYESADVLMPWGISGDKLANMPRLRWIQTISAGVDFMDLAEMQRRQIMLTNTSGIHAPSISEHILAMMLAFARRLPHLVHEQQLHRWHSEIGRVSAFEITGQTLMVLGLGHIGEQLALRAKGLQMRVIGVRRRLDINRPSVADEVIGLDTLAARIGEADHVAITLPRTSATERLVSAELIRQMKPGAYLYNIGRGSIVDQNALIAALQDGHLGGAGLDVTDPEPLPADSPLWDMDNVIITPHTSGSSPLVLDRAIAVWIENLRRFLSGEKLTNIVDLDAGY